MSRVKPGFTKIEKSERIAKVIARAGLCSRREAERWISEGRVMVDGKVLSSPATLVAKANKIIVDGQLLPEAKKPTVWRYHKPAGLLTTHSDPEGRPTLFDSLPPYLPRVISIGRCWAAIPAIGSKWNQSIRWAMAPSSRKTPARASYDCTLFVPC